jgi:hypothetical protein
MFGRQPKPTLQLLRDIWSFHLNSHLKLRLETPPNPKLQLQVMWNCSCLVERPPKPKHLELQCVMQPNPTLQLLQEMCRSRIYLGAAS